jgi:hypothetical protein
MIDKPLLRCIKCFGSIDFYEYEVRNKKCGWYAVCSRCNISYPLKDDGTFDENFVDELSKNLAAYHLRMYDYYFKMTKK